MSTHIPTIITIATAALGLVGAYLKLRPHRIFVWLAAVKERETLLAMLECEQTIAAYWKARADECWDQFNERQS